MSPAPPAVQLAPPAQPTSSSTRATLMSPTSPKVSRIFSPAQKKVRRRANPPTPEDIQQIITDKLHKAMSELLNKHPNQPLSVGSALQESINSLSQDLDITQHKLLDESNQISEIAVPVHKVNLKLKRRKPTSKAKRRTPEPRYASNTIATARRRKLTRVASSPTLADAPSTHGLGFSTPESTHPQRSSGSYVSKFFSSA